MKKSITHKKCLVKRLDGRWEWDVLVWTTKMGIFADCIVTSPVGKSFETESEAKSNMNKILKKLGILKIQL